MRRCSFFKTSTLCSEYCMQSNMIKLQKLKPFDPERIKTAKNIFFSLNQRSFLWQSVLLLKLKTCCHIKKHHPLPSTSFSIILDSFRAYYHTLWVMKTIWVNSELWPTIYGPFKALLTDFTLQLHTYCFTCFQLISIKFEAHLSHNICFLCTLVYERPYYQSIYMLKKTFHASFTKKIGSNLKSFKNSKFWPSTTFNVK